MFVFSYGSDIPVHQKDEVILHGKASLRVIGRAELPRRLPLQALELPIEVGEVAETDSICDQRDRLLCVDQQGAGIPDSELRDVIACRHTGLQLEQPME
jgi:hypothetical protein